MANNDLLRWTTSDVDFYELLGIAFENCTESELRRAYRKTALKLHPDKAGKDFDPEKYELFQAANDVLSDPELKAKYDNHRNAKLQKQRANELFEGKRRQMKEDLEARERGGASNGLKRPREHDSQTELQKEMQRLAEEGRKRRAARATMMAENTPATSPGPPPRPKVPEPEVPGPKAPDPIQVADDSQEDQIASLERRIREAQESKAKRKAEKKARRSGVFAAGESPSVAKAEARNGIKVVDSETATPIKRPDIFKGLKADEKSSASPRFSFSPSTLSTPKRNDFTATMARLKAAEKQRLEDEIRQQESKQKS